MSEQMRADAFDVPLDDTSGEGEQQPVRTGVPEVDDVLADVDGLSDVPIEEHVATFERAHETLRGALDGRAGDQVIPAGGTPDESA